jgi:hypothetical protein
MSIAVRPSPLRPSYSLTFRLLNSLTALLTGSAPHTVSTPLWVAAAGYFFGIGKTGV